MGNEGRKGVADPEVLIRFGRLFLGSTGWHPYLVYIPRLGGAEGPPRRPWRVDGRSFW